ncbi:hypothetical protein ABT173_20680 [Streptomyces sp. NPDC001795]|uniref:hypothetical protein n=1 Tax=unclassified Streptomyces TaxID=2593676 RepID=UPI003320B856
MPRDIDDHVRRRDREQGEVSTEETRKRDRRDTGAGGSDVSDPGVQRERHDRRTSWDDDDEDMQHGYR